jgi:hypothetical protein
MKKLWCLAVFVSMTVSSLSFAQEEESDSADAASAALTEWLGAEGSTAIKSLPRRWLFMQTQATAYGAPSPLIFDRSSFESYGWFEATDPDAIRFYFQMNPKLRDGDVKDTVIRQRLQTFMNLTASDGLIVRETDKEAEKKDGEVVPAWVFYGRSGKGLVELGRTDKGPDSMRQDALPKWLISQLGYDAIAVGTSQDYLILAKLKPVKRGSQGLIMKGTTNTVLLKDNKDVGALVRVVFEAEDFLVVKFLLSKSGKPKVPVGSKVLFSD